MIEITQINIIVIKLRIIVNTENTKIVHVNVDDQAKIDQKNQVKRDQKIIGIDLQ